MNPIRRQRLGVVLFILLGVAGATALALNALRENADFFFPPAAIVAGEAPVGVSIRAGGMVQDGTVQRGDGLRVSFVVSDLAGADVPVEYVGILPDLFREGQGVVAAGQLRADGTFVAERIYAKHDENYMPPELADIGARVANQ